jgi:Zn-dependent peptidase ImmA (M78 family)
MPKNRRLKNPEYVPKPPALIRKEARDLRRLLKIDRLHAPDLTEVLNHLSSRYSQFKLKLVADSDLPRAEARAYCKAWVLKVRKSVISAVRKFGDGRARWTIAHEIGHLVLNHPRSLDRKSPGQEVNPEDQLLEREADIFASEFLAPSHLVSNNHTPNDIRAIFQISLDAATRRRKEIEDERSAEEATDVAPTVQSDKRKTPEKRNQTTLLPAKIPVFVSMPFNPEMTCLYLEVLKPTIEGMGMSSQRADEISSAETIADDIRRAINDSKLMIADISNFNPNVMHEIGLAQSINKPTIIICRNGYREEQIPSNIRHIRRIIYPNHAGGGPVLRRQLEQTLEFILSCWRAA